MTDDELRINTKIRRSEMSGRTFGQINSKNDPGYSPLPMYLFLIG